MGFKEAENKQIDDEPAWYNPTYKKTLTNTSC
jgi:hypothetical protein